MIVCVAWYIATPRYVSSGVIQIVPYDDPCSWDQMAKDIQSEKCLEQALSLLGPSAKEWGDSRERQREGLKRCLSVTHEGIDLTVISVRGRDPVIAKNTVSSVIQAFRGYVSVRYEEMVERRLVPLVREIRKQELIAEESRCEAQRYKELMPQTNAETEDARLADALHRRKLQDLEDAFEERSRLLESMKSKLKSERLNLEFQKGLVMVHEKPELGHRSYF